MSLTPQQLEARAHALGGTDCAPVLGLSRFKTSRQLYHEKRGELSIEREESEVMAFGRYMEPAVRSWYAEKTGRIVRQPTGTLVHPEFDFMRAHIDGFTEEGGGAMRGYEGKTAMASAGWGDAGTDQVPLDAYFQCQHYMLVTGFSAFDVVCLIGRRFMKYEVLADAELQGFILEAERDFMRRVAEADAPELDYQHATALEVLRRVYPGTTGEIIMATDETIRLREAMQQATETEREAKKLKNAAKAQLLDIMGEAALLRFSDGKCLRRQLVERGAYEVAAASYIDSRLINTPR